MTNLGTENSAGSIGDLPEIYLDPTLGWPILRPLLEGKLHIDCTEISLAGKLQGVPTQYLGPGYIAQTEPDGFAVTIFINGALLHSGIPQSGGLAGTLSSSVTSLTLDATDESGRKWQAENIWSAASSGCVGGTGHVVRTSCHELAMQRPADVDGFSLEVWSRSELPLPYALAGRCQPIIEQPERLASGEYLTTVLADTFQSCGLNFAVFHHHGNTCVRAIGEQALPDHLGPRVWEAMLFTFGGPLGWSAIRYVGDKTERLRICSPRRACSNDCHPPILDHLQPPTGDVWRIFDHYLQYVLKVPRPEDPKLHPLSSQVFAVRNSQGLSLEARSLVLTVAVESVLDTFFPDRGQQSAPNLTAVNDLMTYVDAWPTENQPSRKRAKGRAKSAISGFKNASAKDRLHALLLLGAVSENGVKAWKKLRNAAAHGDWREFRSDNQGGVDQIGAVATLFHQLIFHRIDYRGMYTDYGTHRWPSVQYPPARDPLSAPAGDADA